MSLEVVGDGYNPEYYILSRKHIINLKSLNSTEFNSDHIYHSILLILEASSVISKNICFKTFYKEVLLALLSYNHKNESDIQKIRRLKHSHINLQIALSKLETIGAIKFEYNKEYHYEK